MAKLNGTQSDDAALAAAKGTEAGSDFALYTEIDLEEGVSVIRAEAKSRIAESNMFEHERKAYVRAFVQAACEALGI
jgi:hypothetical protein